MPWRGADEPGEFPTLGYAVAQFIESTCVVPDGDHQGSLLRLSDAQYRWLLWFYRLRTSADPDRPHVAWEFGRGGQLVAPQKWGKGPFAAAVTIAEAAGPVLFAGWDAAGEPVGRPWATPWVQVTAVSEDQTDNVWRALQPMIELSDLHADIPDTGQTRINLPGGGRIEPVTSSARSRLGQRITFAVQDEAHDWTVRNGGRRLADNQRRNLAGMGGRFMETGNAWDPAEESVAQATFESKTPGVFKMMVDAGAGSVRNRRDRRRMLRRVYAGSWWVDLDRIDAEIEDLLGRGDASQAERFYMNRIVAAEDAAYDVGRWQQLARADYRPADGARITVGVDGARWDDALAIVATEVSSGFQWPVLIMEAPADADDDYEHDMEFADQLMVDLFDRFDVWRVYIDPQRIEPLVNRWQGRWSPRVVVEWFTNRPRQIAHAVRQHVQAVQAGDVSHDGDEVLERHIRQAVRRKVNVKDDDNRQMFTLSKDRPYSGRKMDGAMAAVLSWECRGDAIAAGSSRPKRRKKLQSVSVM